ncbi:ribulose bisphosphate carboxylase small subunit [Rhodopila sp.]|uniref:ribulose bisphosphate carboxylase small subunit n=1 Tax=Rhodopila sp. TaxID=2480087 RepID=UPI003D116DD6
MKITQGQFSFLPDLTDEEIGKQVEYALDNGWALAVEHTDDPHPRNTYWLMWGLPMFDLKDPAGVLMEVNACRREHPNDYIKVLAFDNRKGHETIRMFFMVQRPEYEPGFEVIRAAGRGRTVNYTLRSYATERPPGQRYQPTGSQ